VGIIKSMAKTIKFEGPPLLKKVLKIKTLQKHGSARCVTIPKSWRLALGWTDDSLLVMTFDPYLSKVIISKDEKVDSLITIAD